MATTMNQHVDTQQRDNGPWYKQFWAWFILTPLLVVVVTSATFVSLAVINADDVVIDNYYKEGRLINQRFEQDEAAAALKLTGQLRFDLELGEVLLSIQGETEFPEVMALLVNHPTRADSDVQVRLQRIASGRYRGDLVERPDHRRYLRLVPVAEASEQNAAAWRLTGEIDFAASDSISFGQL